MSDVVLFQGAHMFFGAILAGGIGARMEIESMPKQFLPLADKPILQHTLEKFSMVERFESIYVGVCEGWSDFAAHIIADVKSNIPIRAIKGGDDRNDTIMQIIRAIEDDYGNSEEHFLITHDSVRPFVKYSTIVDNIKIVEEYGACDTVVPATDTIVYSESGELIADIPERRFMYQGQTPQSFKIGFFKHAYENISSSNRKWITDACKMLLLDGIPVATVRGDATNIKLTTVMDYKIAQAIVKCGIEPQ